MLHSWLDDSVLEGFGGNYHIQTWPNLVLTWAERRVRWALWPTKPSKTPYPTNDAILRKIEWAKKRQGKGIQRAHVAVAWETYRAEVLATVKIKTSISVPVYNLRMRQNASKGVFQNWAFCAQQTWVDEGVEMVGIWRDLEVLAWNLSSLVQTLLKTASIMLKQSKGRHLPEGFTQKKGRKNRKIEKEENNIKG